MRFRREVRFVPSLRPARLRIVAAIAVSAALLVAALPLASALALVPGGPGGGHERCSTLSGGAGYITTSRQSYGAPGLPLYSRTWSVDITDDNASRSPGAAECATARSVVRDNSVDATSAGTRKEHDGATCTFDAPAGYDHARGTCVSGDLTIEFGPSPTFTKPRPCAHLRAPRPPGDATAAPHGFYWGVAVSGAVSCAQADAVVRQVWKVRPTSRYVLIRRTAPTRGAGTWVCGVSLQHQPGTARRPASTSGFGACALGLHEPGYRQLVQTGTDLLWAGPINS